MKNCNKSNQFNFIFVSIYHKTVYMLKLGDLKK